MKNYVFLALFMMVGTYANAFKILKIGDIKTAKCSSEQGGSFVLDNDTKIITASFAGLEALTNNREDDPEGDGKFIEVMEEYPDEKYDAIGTLGSNETAFGNTSLLFKKGAALYSKEKAVAFFMDMGGNSKTEEMTCDLDFYTSDLE